MPHSSGKPGDNTDDNELPLYRPEAVLARQQRESGDIRLSAPISGKAMCRLSMGIALSIITFTELAPYVQQVMLSGVVVANSCTLAGQRIYSCTNVLFQIPSNTHFASPGTEVTVVCPACLSPSRESIGVVSSSDASTENVLALSPRQHLLDGEHVKSGIVSLNHPVAGRIVDQYGNPQALPAEVYFTVGRMSLAQYLLHRQQR
jgi:hypothetical protein